MTDQFHPYRRHSARECPGVARHDQAGRQQPTERESGPGRGPPRTPFYPERPFTERVALAVPYSDALLFCARSGVTVDSISSEEWPVAAAVALVVIRLLPTVIPIEAIHGLPQPARDPSSHRTGPILSQAVHGQGEAEDQERDHYDPSPKHLPRLSAVGFVPR